MNTKMRAAAKNDMEKDFHKLMNNAVYGKTCENQRKRTDIHRVNDRVKAAKLVDKPHCLDARLFNEKLVGIEMQKVKMLLTKPSYVGFVVLELSKLHMLKYALPTYHPISTITSSYFQLNLYLSTYLTKSYMCSIGSTTTSSRRGMGRRPISSSQIPTP